MEGRFVVLTEDIRKVLNEDRVRFEKTMQITVITDGIFGNYMCFTKLSKIVHLFIRVYPIYYPIYLASEVLVQLHNYLF
jgi:hypothetical protein